MVVPSGLQRGHRAPTLSVSTVRRLVPSSALVVRPCHPSGSACAATTVQRGTTVTYMVSVTVPTRIAIQPRPGCEAATALPAASTEAMDGPATNEGWSVVTLL